MQICHPARRKSFKVLRYIILLKKNLQLEIAFKSALHFKMIRIYDKKFFVSEKKMHNSNCYLYLHNVSNLWQETNMQISHPARGKSFKM